MTSPHDHGSTTLVRAQAAKSAAGTAHSPTAAEFLVDLAQRLVPDGDATVIRHVAERVCGSRLDTRGPDGRRASTLTTSGIPFEASVTGGGGEISPDVRYTVESASQETDFGARVAAQLATIRAAVAWLPNGDRAMADLLQSFVSALYPNPANVTGRHRSATWLGIVHHAALPHHVARLKVYGGPRIVPGARHRLCDALPGFAELVPAAVDEELFAPIGAAIDVDARGTVQYKVYLEGRFGDVAVPKRLVRYFGEPAWAALSEFVRCGVDPADLHRHRLYVCCSRGGGQSAFGLHLCTGRRTDISDLARELAARHHGSTRAVDALARAAGARRDTAWHFSAVGLGCSGDDGIDKLNVYGIPVWGGA